METIENENEGNPERGAGADDLKPDLDADLRLHN